MIRMYQKNDIVVVLNVKDEEGSPFDFTNCNVFFSVRHYGRDVYIVKSLDEGIVVIDEGKLEIDLTNDDTDISTGHYNYEVLVIDASGNRYTAKQDQLRIKESYAKGVE